MELHMGSKIAERRRAKGLTQEQLAAELGISAPAVSKWETDSSYPDITLLCPLARALGTDVDTLLAYEEELSQEKLAEYAGRILKINQEQGLERAEKEQKALELCGIYRKLEEIIYEGAGNSALVSAAVYGKSGQEQQAADCLVSYLESYAEGSPKPNPLLFVPTVSGAKKEGASTKEIREMLLRVIMEDEVLAKLCEREEVQDALYQGGWR